MTDSEIIEQIKMDLGYPVIDVYTPDASIQSFIRKGLNVFTSQVFRRVSFVVPCKACQTLDKEKIVFVFEVVPYQFTTGAGDNIPVYYRDDFSLATAVQYFNIYSSNDILTPVAASLTYNQMNYAFNMQFDWKYDTVLGQLFTTHIPEGTQVLVVKAKTYYDRETLDPEYEAWLLRYAEGQTKITEGRIRGKYKEGSVGATSDADQLVSEGQQEIQACMDEIQSYVPMDVGRRA
jgi:hypothetical protein